MMNLLKILWLKLKKNWKIVLICLGALLIVLLILIKKLFSAPKPTTSNDKNFSPKTEGLKDSIVEIKGQINEVRTLTAIRVTGIRTKNQAIIDEVTSIEKMPDPTERRNAAVALWKRINK